MIELLVLVGILVAGGYIAESAGGEHKTVLYAAFVVVLFAVWASVKRARG